MSKVKLLPTAGKIWVRPDSFDKFEKAEKGYWKEKDKSIVLPESAVVAKETQLKVGTIIDCCQTSGLDFPSGIRHTTFNVGERIVYFAANVSILKYEGEYYHILPSEFVVAKIEREQHE